MKRRQRRGPFPHRPKKRKESSVAASTSPDMKDKEQSEQAASEEKMSGRTGMMEHGVRLDKELTMTTTNIAHDRQIENDVLHEEAINEKYDSIRVMCGDLWSVGVESMVVTADTRTCKVWSCGSANGVLFLEDWMEVKDKFLKFCTDMTSRPADEFHMSSQPSDDCVRTSDPSDDHVRTSDPGGDRVRTTDPGDDPDMTNKPDGDSEAADVSDGDDYHDDIETHSDSVLPEINLSPSSKTSQNKETYVKSRPYRVQTRSACKQTTVKTQLGTSNLGKGNSKREIKVSHGKLTQNGTHKQRKGKGIREKTVDNGKDRAAGGSGSNTVVQGCSRKQIKLEPKSREDKRTKEKIVTDPKDSVVKNDGILNQTKSGHEGNVEKTVSTKIKARIKNGSEALKAAIGTELKDINVKEEAGIKSEKLEDLIGSIADCNFVTVKKDGVETVWPIDKVYDKREDGSLQPYTCKMCCKYFRTRSLVINHVRTVHSSDTPYRCKVCAELYKEKDAILKHIRIHEDKIQHLKIYGGKNQHSNQCKTEDKSRPLLDYKCVLCGFEAKNKVEIREHFTKIHNKMKVKCDQCEKPFRDSFALRRHKVVKHSTEKNVKCDVCSKAFKLHENMILHRRRFHDPKFECEICGAKQPTSYILKKHVEMVHEKKNEMVCEVCGKGFVYAHRFRIHKRRHEGEFPFKCSFCDKRYTSKESCTHHENTHTREREFICDLCGKKYLQYGHLARHKQLHDKSSRPIKCKYCDAGFRAYSAYRSHVFKEHREAELATGSNMILKCEYCPKLFAHPTHLKSHIYRHTGEKPYSCEICGKTFNDKSNLRQHKYSHDDKEVYHCSYCPKVYTQRRGYRAHLKTHEGKEGDGEGGKRVVGADNVKVTTAAGRMRGSVINQGNEIQNIMIRDNVLSVAKTRG